MQWTNKSSLTEVQRAQRFTLHGKEYTVRNIGSKLCCSKTTVHNDTFHDRKRSGRPQKTISRDHCSMRQIAMHTPNTSWKKIRASLRLKGTAVRSSSFETSQQRSPTGRHDSHIWLQWWRKKDGTLPDVIAIGLSLNAQCSSLYIAACTLGGHWVRVLTRNM